MATSPLLLVIPSAPITITHNTASLNKSTFFMLLLTPSYLFVQYVKKPKWAQFHRRLNKRPARYPKRRKLGASNWKLITQAKTLTTKNEKQMDRLSILFFTSVCSPGYLDNPSSLTSSLAYI